MPTSYVRFSPRGKFLSVYKKSRGTITLIDMHDFSTHAFHAPDSDYNFNEEETALFSVQGSKKGNSFRVWNIASKEEIKSDFAPGGLIALLQSLNNHLLIVTDDPLERGHMEKITLLTIKGDGLVETIIPTIGKKIHCGYCNFALHLDKSMLAVSSYDDVNIWDLASFSLIRKFKHYNVNDLCFNKGGTLLATASDDCTVALWDTEDKGRDENPRCVKAEDPRHVVLSAEFFLQEHILFSSDECLRIWDTSKDEPKQICAIRKAGGSITASPQGQFFAPANDSDSLWCFPIPGQFDVNQLCWLHAACMAHKLLNGVALADYLNELKDEIETAFGDQGQLMKDHLKNCLLLSQ